jgi:NADPH-dependent curcumin reductase CurA
MADLSDFQTVATTLPEPDPGQALVRNLVMSLDPGMRSRMNDVKSYLPPYQLHQPLDGEAIGEVIESRSSLLRPGDIVLHRLGWREHALVEADSVSRVDTDIAPTNAYLGVLGTPGLTAYVGITESARITPGDTVWISAASGAVGQIAGQLAKLRGAGRVIGSAGSADKVARLLDELGFDAAFNYRDGSVSDLLSEAAPSGIDVYFDNVGGDHLEAAIATANVHARFVACGALSAYNEVDPPTAPHNLRLIIGKRLTIRGLLVLDHLALRDQFVAEIAPLVADGSLHYRESVIVGLDNAATAFIDMLRGQTHGKTLVQLHAR